MVGVAFASFTLCTGMYRTGLPGIGIAQTKEWRRPRALFVTRTLQETGSVGPSCLVYASPRGC